eukprot:gene4248-7585_t
MIEILIAVSIIVTFSGLTGVVMARKYEESKEAYAKIDLIKIQEGLIMYFTKNSKYPLDLEQLLENGDLSKIPLDPWGSSYLYFPHIDWVRLTRVLNGKNLKNDEQFNYFIEGLKRLSAVLNSLPESIEPIEMISIASEQPFSICVGTKIPKFPSTVNVNVSRDKIKQTANLMKIALEKSSSIPELNEILTKLISQIKS